MKIIQINTSSVGLNLNEEENKVNINWGIQVARELRKKDNNLKIECWFIEKGYLKEFKKAKEGIKFRIFPTNFSIRHGMEISLSIINALNKEIINSAKQNDKLIIHLHEYHSWQAYLILDSIKKCKGIKIIAQHHGGRSPLENLKRYKRLILFLPLILLMQLLEKKLFKKIDTFYALSDDEINYLKRITPKSKVKFQTMGISEKYYIIQNKKELREKLKLNINKKYILYIGRIKTTKGIKELLDAMKKIDNKSIGLLIIGGGADYDKYNKYTKGINLKNVKFLGEIYGDKKLDYLSACDCLILPSYTEGAPVVLMEAIAKNLPVIVTDVGGISKMIANGREGIIIRPRSSEEIIKAIENILKWKDKDIRKHAEKYKWRRIIKNTIRDYITE